MKFTYVYKTSDGVRHEAAMDAESREAVFATLRTQGIKAIKVVAADGSKANGEVRGVRKRIVVAIAVTAAFIVGIAAYFLGESNNRTILFPRRVTRSTAIPSSWGRSSAAISGMRSPTRRTGCSRGSRSPAS